MKIFVNGTFDILHKGHIALLNYAKSLGNYLTVGIDSDARIKELKGSDRPVNSQEERKILLENLKAVDEVKIFNTDQELVDLVKDCDTMVKGSDYIDRKIIGIEVCSHLVFFNRIHGYSTTEKIQSIVAGRQLYR
jgi:D-beta-D-heptose 7-phosphate kinase/D-beta-D-heptose 1-phosphate adenosyltransferase